MTSHARLDDATIREMAEARVAFRRHALAYALVNPFLVAVWFLRTEVHTFASYWPVWVHLGWGLGLAFHAWQAYGNGGDAVAREERKIRERHGQR